MTVSELIKKLLTIEDKEKIVMINDFDEGYGEQTSKEVDDIFEQSGSNHIKID